MAKNSNLVSKTWNNRQCKCAISQFLHLKNIIEEIQKKRIYELEDSLDKATGTRFSSDNKTLIIDTIGAFPHNWLFNSLEIDGIQNCAVKLNSFLRTQQQHL
jgi:hypothetical protein